MSSVDSSRFHLFGFGPDGQLRKLAGPIADARTSADTVPMAKLAGPIADARASADTVPMARVSLAGPAALDAGPLGAEASRAFSGAEAPKCAPTEASPRASGDAGGTRALLVARSGATRLGLLAEEARVARREAVAAFAAGQAPDVPLRREAERTLDLAAAALELGQPHEAARALQGIASSRAFVDSPDLTRRLGEVVGRIDLSRLGHADRARVYLVQAVAISFRNKDLANAQIRLGLAEAALEGGRPHELAEVHVHYGRVLDEQSRALKKAGDLEGATEHELKALRNYDRASRLLEKSGDKSAANRIRIHLAINQAFHLEGKGRLAEARAVLSAAAEKARPYPEGETQLAYNLGRLHVLERRPGLAIPFLLDAAARGSDRLARGIALQNLGVAFRDSGDLEKARAYLQRALGPEGFMDGNEAHKAGVEYTKKLLADLPAKPQPALDAWSMARLPALAPAERGAGRRDVDGKVWDGQTPGADFAWSQPQPMPQVDGVAPLPARRASPKPSS